MSAECCCIGVDVGYTNTDAVILRGNTVIGWAKTTTTEDVTGGVVAAITTALRDMQSQGHMDSISQVNIGTNQFENAVIKRRNLAKVSVIRLCGPASTSLPPCIDMPADLRKVVCASTHLLQGGNEYDGTEITSVDIAEVKGCIQQIKEKGIENVVVCGIFSPVNSAQELEVAAILKEEYPGVSLTLSHTVSGIGLLERENAAVLNESLKPYFLKTTSDFDIALQSLGLDCSLYLTQNDGTILSAKDFLEFPVRTFVCGTSNIVRGASHLACIEDATVIDIGGTYTHVCGMAGGFPRLTSSIVEMGGVRTSLRIPAEKRICLGGGSHVNFVQLPDAKKSVKVGPLSCGNKLTIQGMVFGELVENQVLTATDTAVAAGVANVGKPEKANQLDEQLFASAVKEMRLMVEAALDQVKMEPRDQPVILLGGGSILIDDKQKLQGASSVIRPPLFEVANAVGAALAQVGTEYSKIVKMDKKVKQIIQEHTAGKSVFDTGVRDVIHMTMSDVADESKPFTSSVNFGKVFRQSIHGDVSKNDIKDAGFSDASAEQEQTTMGDIDGQPRIDTSTGEWLLSEWDVDCIALGASILGCGGGGEPYLQKLQCKLILRDGKKIRIITPESINNTGFVSCVAALGAPLIEIEKPAVDTIIEPVVCLQQIITSNNILDEAVDIEEDLNGLKYIDDFHGQLVKNVDTPGLSAIMSAEIGGVNSLIPLYVGGLLDLPVVDADFMGRAFPEFQMCIPNMFDVPAYPCAFSKAKVIIDGYNAYAGQSLRVECRNENLTATLHCMTGESKVVACVPDLIAIVDTDTGEAIHFDELRNNLRVTVLVFASPHILRTPTALKVVGPQAFGYPEDVQYHPVADYTEYKPVHQCAANSF
ncbi:uncharacterized protein LOC100376092 [Saccoglossus kowalevskii]|uniref:Uncharacterized protein LOC100376092 n=1 Tax=Saccoglossus kowalevskii TaxID=10224 RepID=A0ABM0LUU9_SACKO|nr:PREDICTED: uncharacterized protein LOC100376092 [Saccoglossus kowalevskii]